MNAEETTFVSTRTLMTASAAFMAVLGLAAAFFPHEILAFFAHPASGFAVVLMKVVGGLYLGLAALDWMARRNAIGGIYSRPVAVANLVHFLVVALVLLRHLPDTTHVGLYVAGGGLNAVFAAAFGWLVYCGRGDADGPSCG